MIYVTPEYMEAITAPERTMTAEIALDMIDTTAKNDIVSITANSNDDRRNLPWFTVDNDRAITSYGTCEKDQFRTKGFYLLPHDSRNEVGEWGWWGLYQSDENGGFSVNPKISYFFSEPHSSLGVTLYLANPVYRVKLVWYDSGGQIMEETVAELSGKSIEIVEHGIENYFGLSIEFIKVDPYRYVKLIEVDFGLHIAYSDTEIVSLNVLEEVDLDSNYLSSNSFDFTLNDREQRFNIFNPGNQSRYLQKNQKVTITSGLLVEGEYQRIPMGEFYLSDWKSPTPYTTTFSGYDLIQKMSGTWYTSRFYQGQSAYEVLDDLLFELGYSDYELYPYLQGPFYYIHDNVKEIMLTGYVEPMEFRDALQQILFSCRAVAKVDRDGILNIYRATPEERNKAIIDAHTIYRSSHPSGSFVCGQNPLLVSDIEAVPNPIVIDKSLSQLPSVEVYDYYSRVNVEQFNWILSKETTTLFEGEVHGDAVIQYSKYPAANIRVQGAVQSWKNFACSSELKNANGSVLITGNVYEEQKSTVSASLTNVQAGNLTEIKGIKIIGSNETANAVASWTLKNLQNRIKQSFQWWVNPALEPTDLVKLENQHGDLMEVQVTKNTFSYNSGWSGESEAVGLVD